jgi:hypothetical protein
MQWAPQTTKTGDGNLPPSRCCDLGNRCIYMMEIAVVVFLNIVLGKNINEVFAIAIILYGLREKLTSRKKIFVRL